MAPEISQIESCTGGTGKIYDYVEASHVRRRKHVTLVATVTVAMTTGVSRPWRITAGAHSPFVGLRRRWSVLWCNHRWAAGRFHSPYYDADDRCYDNRCRNTASDNGEEIQLVIWRTRKQSKTLPTSSLSSLSTSPDTGLDIMRLCAAFSRLIEVHSMLE